MTHLDSKGVASLLTWLALVMGMIVFMVVVGGITRLTNSGLSMVTWEPIMGTLPPLSEADWEHRFDQYKSFPEYQQLNVDMSLDEFKGIFFWEYMHRLLGRLLGIVYAIPFLWFWIRGKLDRRLKKLLSIGLLLGGSQGLLGWYMVKSGLVENPYVSHYRLAAHLGLAFLVLIYLQYVFLSYFPFDKKEEKASRKAQVWGVSLFVLLVVQIVWGAFVAGLNAGYMYNTFPKMQGYWLPPGWDAVSPVIMNFLDNPVTVQLTHRALGLVLLVVTVGACLALIRDKTVSGRKRKAFNVFIGIMAAQIVFGIFTLTLQVPVALAVMHQVTACILLGAAFYMLYTFRGGSGIWKLIEENKRA